jgi:hypothetical protein
MNQARDVIANMEVLVAASDGRTGWVRYEEWLPVALRAAEIPFDPSKIFRPAVIQKPAQQGPSPRVVTAQPLLPSASSLLVSKSPGHHQSSVNLENQARQHLSNSGAVRVAVNLPPTHSQLPERQSAQDDEISIVSSTIPAGRLSVSAGSLLRVNNRPKSASGTTTNPTAPPRTMTPTQLQSLRSLNATAIDAKTVIVPPGGSNLIALAQRLRNQQPGYASTFSKEYCLVVNMMHETFVVKLPECTCGTARDLHPVEHLMVQMGNAEKFFASMYSTDAFAYISPWFGDRYNSLLERLRCNQHADHPENCYLFPQRLLDSMFAFYMNLQRYRTELAVALRARLHLLEWLIFYRSNISKNLQFIRAYGGNTEEARRDHQWYDEEYALVAAASAAAQQVYTPQGISFVMEEQVIIAVNSLLSSKRPDVAAWLWRLWLTELELRDRTTSVCPFCDAYFSQSHITRCHVCAAPLVSKPLTPTEDRTKKLFEKIPSDKLLEFTSALAMMNRARTGPPMSRYAKPPAAAAAAPPSGRRTVHVHQPYTGK